MKIIAFFMFSIFSLSITAQEIKWMTFEEAQKSQKKEARKIFVDAYTVWCGPCKMLDKNTFHNKDVADYVNKNYYPVKFNAEGNETITFNGKKYTNPGFNPNSTGRNSQHQLTTHFGVRAYPTLIYLDEEGNLLAPIPGYQTPSQLELFLKFFKDDFYKNVKTQEDWEAYTASFVPKFKE